MRLIAPAGARQCGLTQWSLNGTPQPRGAPDAAGIVDIAVNARAHSLRFFCTIGRQRVYRTIQSIVIWRGSPPYSSPNVTMSAYPPLIHMGGRDAQSDMRWEAWQAQVCTGHTSSDPICKPENVAAFKAADLGAEAH